MLGAENELVKPNVHFMGASIFSCLPLFLSLSLSIDEVKRPQMKENPCLEGHKGCNPVPEKAFPSLLRTPSRSMACRRVLSSFLGVAGIILSLHAYQLCSSSEFTPFIAWITTIYAMRRTLSGFSRPFSELFLSLNLLGL